MSLQTELQDLTTAFVTDIRDLSLSSTGASNRKNSYVAANLATTAKNFVDAINEVKTTADAATGAAVTSVNGESGPGAITLTTTEIGEGSNLYLTAARVMAAVLTGYSVGAGTVAATDTVLQAIQKLDGNIQAIDITNIINDVTAGATTTYSSNKITSDIAAAVSDLVSASPAALDTLNELATALGNDANFATTMTTALGLKANVADTKSVTELGAAVDTTDYSAAYIAARDA